MPGTIQHTERERDPNTQRTLRCFANKADTGRGHTEWDAVSGSQIELMCGLCELSGLGCVVPLCGNFFVWPLKKFSSKSDHWYADTPISELYTNNKHKIALHFVHVYIIIFLHFIRWYLIYNCFFSFCAKYIFKLLCCLFIWTYLFYF